MTGVVGVATPKGFEAAEDTARRLECAVLRSANSSGPRLTLG